MTITSTYLFLQMQENYIHETDMKTGENIYSF